MTKASGFLVVRLPEMNKDFLGGRGAYSAYAPKVDDIYYGGIARMFWFDVSEDYYLKSIPVEIEQAYISIENSNIEVRALGIKLCRDLETAIMLLNYSNKSKPVNELIVVRSEKLSEIKGTIDFDTSKVSWIGYDAVDLGGFTLLEHGLFTAPAYFIEWKDLLNKFGLFSSSEMAWEYAEVYLDAAAKGIVEPVGPNYEFDAIEVGKVHLEGF